MRSLKFNAVVFCLGGMWCASGLAVDVLNPSWFADLPAMSGVTLSPDGRHIAYIGRRGESPAVYTRDIVNPDSPAHLVISNSSVDPASINWCRWAGGERLLCSVQISYSMLKNNWKKSVTEGVREAIRQVGDIHNPYPNYRISDYGASSSAAGEGHGGASGAGAREITSRSTSDSYSIKANTFETRLLSVGVDGSNLLEMGQKDTGQALVQDRVIDWNLKAANSVLMSLDDNLDGYPSVERLDVTTGKLTMELLPRKPIIRYFTDGRGEVRLAQGKDSKYFYYFARLIGDTRDAWRAIAAFPLAGMRYALKPDSVEPGTNKALAFGSDGDRRALYEMNLADMKAKPTLVAHHLSLDVLNGLYATDGRYIGYSYIDERLRYVYTDAQAREAWEIAARQLPDDVSIRIADVTRDNVVYLFEVTSDIDAGSYYALDTRVSTSLKHIGHARPELEGLPLPRTQTIRYQAADGSEIQGFLTLPLESDGKRQAMVVMPHGFTSGVDFKQFDYLRLFLASRGYAVLQMNFRGSWGYGQKWLSAGQDNWAGVAHSDIADGARWAIAQGIADPERLAIAGFNWGGYQALLGGYLDEGLFKAVISLGGISDVINGQAAMDSTSETLVGDKRSQMRRDSPIRHAEDITAPVLLIHGDLDLLADPYHSERMAGFLKGKRKTHTYVSIKTADNRFWQPAERMQLLSSVETFLQQSIGATTAPTSVVTPAASIGASAPQPAAKKVQ